MLILIKETRYFTSWALKDRKIKATLTSIATAGAAVNPDIVPDIVPFARRTLAESGGESC